MDSLDVSLEELKELKAHPDWKAETIKHAVRMGKLKAASGVLGFEQMQDQAERRLRCQAAEEEAAIKAAGWEANVPDDDMRQTILGDSTTINHNHVKQGMGLLGKAILGAATLGVGGAIGAVALHLLTTPDTPVVVVPEFQDTDTDTHRDWQLRGE